MKKTIKVLPKTVTPRVALKEKIYSVDKMLPSEDAYEERVWTPIGGKKKHTPFTPAVFDANCKISRDLQMKAWKEFEARYTGCDYDSRTGESRKIPGLVPVIDVDLFHICYDRAMRDLGFRGEHFDEDGFPIRDFPSGKSFLTKVHYLDEAKPRYLKDILTYLWKYKHVGDRWHRYVDKESKLVDAHVMSDYKQDLIWDEISKDERIAEKDLETKLMAANQLFVLDNRDFIAEYFKKELSGTIPDDKLKIIRKAAKRNKEFRMFKTRPVSKLFETIFIAFGDNWSYENYKKAVNEGEKDKIFPEFVEFSLFENILVATNENIGSHVVAKFIPKQKSDDEFRHILPVEDAVNGSFDADLEYTITGFEATETKTVSPKEFGTIIKSLVEKLVPHVIEELSASSAATISDGIFYIAGGGGKWYVKDSESKIFVTPNSRTPVNKEKWPGPYIPLMYYSRYDQPKRNPYSTYENSYAKEYYSINSEAVSKLSDDEIKQGLNVAPTVMAVMLKMKPGSHADVTSHFMVKEYLDCWSESDAESWDTSFCASDEYPDIDHWVRCEITYESTD